MNSKDLANYIQQTGSISKPWVLAQLRLQKLAERRHTLTPEQYTTELADIHKDIINLGEWWIGQEDEVF